MMTIPEIHKITVSMRRRILTMANRSQSSHVGSALSCVEILAALYFKLMNRSQQNTETDRFILSKGHGAMSWYAVLAEAGLLSVEQLNTYASDGSYLGGHPSHMGSPGIGLSTGSLGHGLAVAAGQALARKMDQRPGRFFVLLSDGECNEGSVWEAAMCAAQQRLDNLVAIIDDNHMQALGPSRQISALDPLADKWRAFGWHVSECDGHDLNALIKTAEDLMLQTAKPKVIIARTHLGKGVSFMQDKILWHYKDPSDDELRLALQELENP